MAVMPSYSISNLTPNTIPPEAVSSELPSSTVEFICVQQRYVNYWWPFAEPFVEEALCFSAGEAMVEDIKNDCLAGHMQLWIVSRKRLTIGAVTTMFVNYARTHVLRIITLSANDFDSWARDGLNLLEEFAKRYECDAIEVWVREGFERKLKEFGLRRSYVVMTVNIK